MSIRSLPFKLPTILLRSGGCFIPTQLSWRRAEVLRARGWAELYPFHERWLGRLTLTDAGKAALAAQSHPRGGQDHG